MRSQALRSCVVDLERDGPARVDALVELAVEQADEGSSEVDDLRSGYQPERVVSRLFLTVGKDLVEFGDRLFGASERPGFIGIRQSVGSTEDLAEHMVAPLA